MLELGDERTVTYTAEDAIEQLGFSWFQLKIILFSCVFSVRHIVCHSLAMS